jgi:tungstate transport system ATP-binding protein
VQYDGQVVLDVPAIDVRPGEVLAVIGPNGAGKSTLLRVLALLARPTRGSVRLQGAALRTEAERLAWRRRMACVFQEALLCRGSVLYNARLASRLRGVARPEADRRAREWLRRLGIEGLADRRVDRLSGGEAQRTSLARAFAAAPEVLFLDEPFAALDAPTRETLLDDLGRLLAATRTTTVLVTHDRAEALRLGDRVAVLLEGRLAELGPPERVFGMPASEAVARFVGVENLLPGWVAARAGAGPDGESGPRPLDTVRNGLLQGAERGRPSPGRRREAECVTAKARDEFLTWPVARAGAGRFVFKAGRREHARSRGHRAAPDRAQRGVPSAARRAPGA